MKHIQKFILFLISILIISFAISLIISPKVRYIAKDMLESFGSEIKLTEINKENYDFTEIKLKELEYGKNCEFNQSLILVNSKHPLDADFEPELERFENTDAHLNACATESFSALREHVKNEFGETLYIMSSYRDKEKQAQLLAEDEKNLAAKPGESEHETGLGIDVYVNFFAGEGFLKSEVGQYVNQNCGKFGFIIRYPFGQKQITGFDYEPWHLRYVGLPHSEIIEDASTTLEEYIAAIKTDCFYSYGDYIISKQDGDSVIIPSEYEALTISPDNTGNYIVTAKIR